MYVYIHASYYRPTLSEDDVQAVSDHVAWRWFENLRHPVLAKAAMWRFASRLVDSMQRKVDKGYSFSYGNLEMMVEETYEEECVEEPWLCIHSAHDSTLIGLLCVLQLSMPSVWPEYGSSIKIELVQEEEHDTNNITDETSSKVVNHRVRFSLNGEVLRSTWLN